MSLNKMINENEKSLNHSFQKYGKLIFGQIEKKEGTPAMYKRPESVMTPVRVTKSYVFPEENEASKKKNDVQ